MTNEMGDVVHPSRIKLTPLSEAAASLAFDRWPIRPGEDDSDLLAKWEARPLSGTAKEQREHLAREYGTVCHLCEQEIDMALRRPHPAAAEVDHILPRASGGTDTLGNIRLAHGTCNSSKNDERGGKREAKLYRQKLSDAVYMHESLSLAIAEAIDCQKAVIRVAIWLKDRSAPGDAWQFEKFERTAQTKSDRAEVLLRERYPDRPTTPFRLDPRFAYEAAELSAIRDRTAEKLATRKAAGESEEALIKLERQLAKLTWTLARVSPPS